MRGYWVRSAILLGVLGLSLFYAKVFYHSGEEFRKGEDAFRQGDFKKALLHYDRAIHWYTPWSSSVDLSIHRLWEMGGKLEERGDQKTALEVYWALRSSLYGVRSFYTPYKEWIERANERIASIWADQEPVSAEEKKITPPVRKERYSAALKKDWAPKGGWSVATEVGFFGWVISALVFIFTFLRKGGGLARGKALFWGGCILVFYALWVIGMVRA
jgi:hypothetical protein